MIYQQQQNKRCPLYFQFRQKYYIDRKMKRDIDINS